ncbi:hypothetical protein D3C76_356680 [compost metagenome]
MVQLHQVLQVNARLLQAPLVAVLAQHLKVAVAVLWVACIQRIDCAITPGHVGLASLVVGAQQQGVFGSPGEEFRLQHVVDDVRMQAFVAAGIGAVEDIAVGIRPTGGIHLVHRHVGILVAEVLACREHIVEAMLELVAEGLLGTLVVVDTRLAFEEVVRQAQAVALVQHAICGVTAVIAAVGVVLQVGLQGQRSVFAEVDADGRRDGVAFFLVVVELRVGSIRQACQAISDTLVVIHGAAEVETHATLALGTDGGLDLMVGGKQRLLGGQRHQASWRATAIQYRRRSLENIDALQEVRVHLHGAVGAVVSHRLEPVDVDVVHRAVVEATHGHIVITMGRPVGVGQYSRCVAHGLGNGL